jgi:hypothetical protein
VDGLLIEHTISKPPLRGRGCRSVKGWHGAKQLGVLHVGRNKAELKRQFHGQSRGYFHSVVQGNVALSGNPFLLPSAEARGFRKGAI